MNDKSNGQQLGKQSCVMKNEVQIEPAHRKQRCA